jgi:hypothetical protein
MLTAYPFLRKDYIFLKDQIIRYFYIDILGKPLDNISCWDKPIPDPVEVHEKRTKTPTTSFLSR